MLAKRAHAGSWCPADRSHVSADEDWRLTAQCNEKVTGGALDSLRGKVRRSGVLGDLEATVAHNVVITHDGSKLFAYAASEEALSAARDGIENVLLQDGLAAEILVSHWDTQLDAWRQIDPPLIGEAAAKEQAFERDAETPETSTVVASAGREVRASFESSLQTWAQELGIACTIVEHPHLLTTQVAFTVTGPRRKIEEFREGLRAEAVATMRTERQVMISPL
jgi:hypothetical protein